MLPLGHHNHRPHSRQVNGARCTEVAAHQSWAQYSSRPTTGAEQWLVRWLPCLIRKSSCVNFQFQLHTQIAWKATHMTHDLCYMLFFIIGTEIKFNLTNSAIHSSGHSLSLFTSSSDYTSVQWRLVLHILLTCSPHVNKSWVTHAIYGIHWGWSHWPIISQHVRGQWGYVVSWACSTGSEQAARVSRSIGNFLNGLNICKFWSLIKMHDLLMCNIIKIMLYKSYSQMLCNYLKTEKSFIAHHWCLQSVVGLECIHWGWSAL